MTTVIIGIGLPGTGKTRYLKNMVAQNGAAYICPDDIRAELTGDAADQSRNGEVWAETYRRIHAELEAGNNVVVDATSAKQPDRQRLIDHCRIKADRIHGMWFVAPLQVILERNKRRDRVVPDFAMGLMAGWLEACPPKEEEGFDLLVQYDTSKR